ncbi:MAG: hypothetical protein RIS90_2340, partial [Pseudomonadota bacterium]
FTRRENLLRAMHTGDMWVAAGLPSARDDGRTRALALLLAAVCGALVWALLRFAG